MVHLHAHGEKEDIKKPFPSNQDEGNGAIFKIRSNNKKVK